MDQKKPFLIVSTHDFKTNLSRYIRMLRKKEVRGIVVRRYQRRLIMVTSLEALQDARKEAAKNVDLVHQH